MLNECLSLRALLLTAIGWVSREQQRAIEYLIEENRILKEQLGNKRLRLTDDQRRRLASTAHRSEVGLREPHDNAYGSHGRNPRIGGPLRQGESKLGLLSNPRSNRGLGPPRRAEHDRPDPAERGTEACPGPFVLVERLHQGHLG